MSTQIQAARGARAAGGMDAIEFQAQQFINSKVKRAQERLAAIVNVHDGLQRLLRSAESGGLHLTSGKLRDLQRGRAALAELAQAAGRELERLRSHERSVAR